MQGLRRGQMASFPPSLAPSFHENLEYGGTRLVRQIDPHHEPVPTHHLQPDCIVEPRAKIQNVAVKQTDAFLPEFRQSGT